MKKVIVMNPIEAAVLPLKSVAMARAEMKANEIVERVRAELEKADGDARIAAPYPNAISMGREEYQKKHARYNLFRMLSKTDETKKVGYRLDDPEYRVMNDDLIARFVKVASDNAAAQYDAFVAKLNSKIGEVTSATLEGNHVWGHSILRVVKADGSKENWKTQMIVNQSKLGTVFNQFPTRKVK